MTDSYKEDPHWFGVTGSLTVDEGRSLTGVGKMSECWVYVISRKFWLL